MRKPFLETLSTLAEQDPKILLIVGDVGFSFIDGYRSRFPNQYLNIGVCEQSMMGVAAGLARQGFKPYVYTMSNFILLRPLEQVRNDIGFANANVKLFGVKGSAAYKFLGASHNLFEGEEKGMLKFIPNIVSYFPETEEETKELVLQEYKRNGPAYFSI